MRARCAATLAQNSGRSMSDPRSGPRQYSSMPDWLSQRAKEERSKQLCAFFIFVDVGTRRHAPCFQCAAGKSWRDPRYRTFIGYSEPPIRRRPDSEMSVACRSRLKNAASNLSMLPKSLIWPLRALRFPECLSALRSRVAQTAPHGSCAATLQMPRTTLC